MALRISILTILLIISTTETRCQNNSDSVKSIVNAIAQRQILQYEKVGIFGEVSDLWIKYQKLKQFASEQELIDNMFHESRVVRCYSFMALNEAKSKKIFEILVNNLKDNESIGIQAFDVIYSRKVSDFYLSSVLPGNISPSEKLRLDSIILINQTIQLAYKNALLNELPATDKYYGIIRRYAELGNGDALVRLARYQRKEDKELILRTMKSKNNQYFVFKAIREFPDKDFFKPLTKQFYKRWYRTHYNFPELRMIYQALAKYPEQRGTIRIFNKTTKAMGRWKRDHFSTYVKVAITKYPHKNFDYLVDRINLSDFNERAFKDYVEIDK